MKTGGGYGCTSVRCLVSLDSHFKHFKEQKVCILWIFATVKENWRKYFRKSLTRIVSK